jgi:hypothetical protein
MQPCRCRWSQRYSTIRAFSCREIHRRRSRSRPVATWGLAGHDCAHGEIGAGAHIGAPLLAVAIGALEAGQQALDGFQQIALPREA